MTTVRINKIDAARRQIVTAIELLFSGGDPVAIHTLAGAGWHILKDLCEQRGTPGHLSVKAMIRQGMENKYWAALTSAMNFFKHADRDADAILDVNEAFSDAIIMIAIMNYVDLGNQHSAEMIAFSTWYRLINPDMLAAPVREQIRTIDATDYGAAPRAKQLEAGRQLLNMNREVRMR